MFSSLRRPSPATRRFRPTLDVLEDRITPATAVEYAVMLADIIVVEIKDVRIPSTGADGFNQVAKNISQALGSGGASSSPGSTSPSGQQTAVTKLEGIALRIAPETLGQPGSGSGGGLFTSAGTGAVTGTFAPP
jgi:hypothetical protein